ncbi:Protein ABHD11 [Hypsibius exemplaris]|uniref:sn-1-specific diacylglycerol lipase ABHD11 n=1 Tax=Hypsibius exemplaris TaxID=2072580 RepID=A0A1W0X406_HYPEX|nr:Protein ABHD11 [Hypsibius exemplaris]
MRELFSAGGLGRLTGEVLFFHRLPCINFPRQPYGSVVIHRSIPLAFTKFQPAISKEGKLPLVDHPVIILHGLFGSKLNWQSIAKVLRDKLTQTVITVDARNHGENPHDDVHSYEVMSEDVEELMEKLNLPSAVLIGHSMGGKAAMCLALRQKPNMIDALIVVDAAPSSSPGKAFFQQNIAAMKAFEFRPNESLPQARNRANKELEVNISDMMVRQFILTNLVQNGDKVSWRVNLDAIERHIEDIMEFPVFHNSYNGPTLFIAGGNSKYITSEEKPEIKRLFPKSVIETVPDAGHWVHSEKPTQVVELIVEFLKNKDDH